jgi:hypothetical protein
LWWPYNHIVYLGIFSIDIFVLVQIHELFFERLRIENHFAKDLFFFVVKLNLVDQVFDPFIVLADLNLKKLY